MSVFTDLLHFSLNEENGPNSLNKLKLSFLTHECFANLKFQQVLQKEMSKYFPNFLLSSSHEERHNHLPLKKHVISFQQSCIFIDQECLEPSLLKLA